MRIFYYAKALWPFFLAIGMFVGGGFLFALLVSVASSSPAPLLGLFLIFGGIPVLVFNAGPAWTELQFQRMRYMSGPKLAQQDELKDLKYLRKQLIRDFGRYKDDEYYKKLCKIDMRIAAAKGKKYKYPNYQPGSPSDW